MDEISTGTENEPYLQHAEDKKPIMMNDLDIVNESEEHGGCKSFVCEGCGAFLAACRGLGADGLGTFSFAMLVRTSSKD